MDKNKLNKALTQIADDFAAQTRSLFPEGSTEPATIGDITELARQTFYALEAYKEAIIKHFDE